MLYWKVIAYGSRQPNIHEKNYSTHDLELVVVVFPLNIWRNYFYGVHVEVYINHKSLQYDFTQKDLNLWQQRLLELFKDYDISVLSKPGKANVVVHALSSLLFKSVSHVDEAKINHWKMFIGWLVWVLD